jgi:pimeloyl-ACP methyl ester carboxylesterase
MFTTVDPSQIPILTIAGRAIRVAAREGAPGWPPLLLCNGLGASLELLQPFVDTLDPRRPVIRFDMPGIGGSPAPVVPYHLGRLAPLLAGQLHIYHGGHLELAADSERLASAVEAFLNADLTEEARRAAAKERSQP